MKPRISVVTLGVANLPRARAFYCDGLGLTASTQSNDNVVFMDMGGMVLALFPRGELAKDAHIDAAGSGFSGVTLAHNLRTKDEVVATLAEAQAAGARILKPAQETFWGGFAGCFADPDGHVWEIAWNPFWPLDDADRIQLPA